jgi:hypothetical protein
MPLWSPAALRYRSAGRGSFRRRLHQDIDQLCESRIGSSHHFLRFDGADWMLHDEQRVIRCIERLALRPRQGFERMGDNCNREPAASLQLD